MSKIKLTGSNSGYVEISSAADAGNLTLALPTSGTELLSNGNNVYTGITTFSNDVKFEGASYDVLWDKSDNQLEFGDNAKLSFGTSSDLQLYHDSNNSIIKNNTNILLLLTDYLQVKSADNVEHLIGADKDGSVRLNYNGNVKVETTNTGAVVTGICTATSFSGSGEGLTYTSPLSHRNIVINGDMRVAQRATSANMSSAGNHIPVCDRWQYNRNGPTATIAQVAEAPAGSGFKYSLKWTNTSPVGSIAAGNVVKFSYAIERQDIQRLGYGHSSGKIATLSFYAKGSLSGKIGVSCVRDSRIFSANEDIVANTWKFVEITIPVDTSTGFTGDDNATGFYFGITWGAGSNSTSGATNSWINFHNAYTAGFTAGQQGAYLTTNGSTFQITGVQLEIGSQATPFEHRSYGEEISRCERYFQCMKGPSSTTTGSNEATYGIALAYNNNRTLWSFNFKTEMRANPTVSMSNLAHLQGLGVVGGWNAASSFVSANNFSKFGGRVDLNWSGTPYSVGHAVEMRITSDGLLGFDAEL